MSPEARNHDDIDTDDLHPVDLHPDDAHADDLDPDDLHPDDVDPDDLHPDDVDPDDLHPDDHAEVSILPGGAGSRHHEDHPRRKRSPLVRWGALVVALVVVATGGWFGVQAIGGMLPSSFDIGSEAAQDYPGPGGEDVEIEIPEGAGGGEIGALLTEADVVASAEAFASLARADDRAATIQPGSYTMQAQMSAEGALDRLVDPAARTSTGVTVREGLWQAEIFDLLAQETGHDVADYEAVTPADLGLPAPVEDLEGYLFPDTYEFGVDANPQDQLQAMVDLGQTRYAEAGVEGQIDPDVLVKASLIEAEANRSDDLPKVAQVIENRLAAEMPLGFDSTIHYIFQERGRAGTTDAQRATEDPYNTYLNPGLPPGPINSPGVTALQAVLEPEEGPWLYFVTVDPSTGETNFATTFEEHEQNVALFQQWCRDNPDSC